MLCYVVSDDSRWSWWPIMALKWLTVTYGFRYVTSHDSMTISFRLRLHGWSQFCSVDVLRLYVPVRIWVIPASNALHATRILWKSSGYVLRFSHSRHNLNILMIFSWCSPVNHGDVMEKKWRHLTASSRTWSFKSWRIWWKTYAFNGGIGCGPVRRVVRFLSGTVGVIAIPYLTIVAIVIS